MTAPALPVGTSLGELTIVETFVFYEGPRLFLAKSDRGRRYIGLFADEGEDWELYLYLPVDDDRLSMVRSGVMTLRDALLDPEAPVLQVTVNWALDYEVSWELALAPSPLPEAYLPSIDARLALPTPTQ